MIYGNNEVAVVCSKMTTEITVKKAKYRIFSLKVSGEVCQHYFLRWREWCKERKNRSCYSNLLEMGKKVGRKIFGAFLESRDTSHPTITTKSNERKYILFSSQSSHKMPQSRKPEVIICVHCGIFHACLHSLLKRTKEITKC